MELNFGELIEVEIQLKDPKKFEKARVKWIFTNGEIRGGRITISKLNKNGLWVQLPKYRSRNGKWVNIIKLDEGLEKSIEQNTLQKYQEMVEGKDWKDIERDYSY